MADEDRKAVRHNEAEAHAWQVQNPFCHHEPHGEEEVGGGDEGEY